MFTLIFCQKYTSIIFSSCGIRQVNLDVGHSITMPLLRVPIGEHDIFSQIIDQQIPLPFVRW